MSSFNASKNAASASFSMYCCSGESSGETSSPNATPPSSALSSSMLTPLFKGAFLPAAALRAASLMRFLTHADA